MVESTTDLPARVRAALVGAGIVSDDDAPRAGEASGGGRAGAFAGGLDAGGPDAQARAAAVWAGVLEVAASELVKVTASASSWSEDARTVVMGHVEGAARALTAAKAPVLVAQEAAGRWRRAGVRSFEAHLAAQGRQDLGAAKREAVTARTLAALEGGVGAAARGQFTASHARKLAAVLETVEPVVGEALRTGAGARHVLELAKDLDPKRFGRRVEELAAAQHPARVHDAHEAIRARRHLRLVHGPDGTKITGLLDPVAGHRVQLALEAASPRPGADDTRTLGQRHADALDTIAGATLTHAPTTRSLEAPTLVTITMSETTFLDAKAHLENATHTHQGGGHGGAENDSAGCDVAPFPTIRIADGPLVPPADLGRLICGSKIGRMIITAHGEPLDVGRTQRLFTGARRRAVEARDQHCAWPDCSTPARYTEVHHLDWWDTDHGHTDTQRGILVCSYHHHELHRHDLDLVKQPPDETTTSPPPLPGDPDYHPPRYHLVPRAHTADERRTLNRPRFSAAPMRVAALG